MQGLLLQNLELVALLEQAHPRNPWIHIGKSKKFPVESNGKNANGTLIGWAWETHRH